MGRISSVTVRGSGGNGGNGADVASFRARRPVAERAVDRLRDGDVADRRSRDDERRTWTPEVDCRIVGCVDVEPVDRSRPVRSDVLWEVAIRRLERCVRPGDWVCMLGGSRIAVCLGNGGHRLAPTAFGDRLARAMGDHLAVGSSGHDLEVSIGIGAGPADAGLEDLTAAAIGAIRSGHRTRAGRRAHQSAPFVAVAHVPSQKLGAGTATTRPATSGPTPDGTAMVPRGRSHRLVRRVMLPLPDQLPRERIDDMAGTLDGVAPASTLRILVVGPEDPADGMPRFTLEAVASVAARVGGRATICPSSQPDQVITDLYVDQPQVAVVVLEPDAARSGEGSGATRPWERAARLVRALRDAGVPVIALGMGASAASVAACVEQGAVGVLDAARLPYELASLAELRSNGHNGTGQNGGGPELNGEVGRGLPAPFSALVNLTRSERRVLHQMMEGLAAAEIAESLVVSIPTVRSHIRSILRKLNVNSQLAAVAIANGTLTERVASG